MLIWNFHTKDLCVQRFVPGAVKITVTAFVMAHNMTLKMMPNSGNPVVIQMDPL